jgi:hypothetical protein
LKALTLWQPWASLVALGEKQIETRCWDTKYRGELAIHASANLPPAYLGRSRFAPEFTDEVADALNCRRDSVDSAIKQLPRASVLCIVKVLGTEAITEGLRHVLCQRELIFGNYEDGRYAWFLELVEKFEEPIPAKGNRMLWNWNAQVAA